MDISVADNSVANLTDAEVNVVRGVQRLSDSDCIVELGVSFPKLSMYNMLANVPGIRDTSDNIRYNVRKALMDEKTQYVKLFFEWNQIALVSIAKGIRTWAKLDKMQQEIITRIFEGQYDDNSSIRNSKPYSAALELHCFSALYKSIVFFYQFSLRFETQTVENFWPQRTSLSQINANLSIASWVTEDESKTICDNFCFVNTKAEETCEDHRINRFNSLFLRTFSIMNVSRVQESLRDCVYNHHCAFHVKGGSLCFDPRFIQVFSKRHKKSLSHALFSIACAYEVLSQGHYVSPCKSVDCLECEINLRLVTVDLDQQKNKNINNKTTKSTLISSTSDNNTKRMLMEGANILNICVCYLKESGDVLSVGQCLTSSNNKKDPLIGYVLELPDNSLISAVILPKNHYV